MTKSKEDKSSAADQIVKLVTESCALFSDDEGQTYARLQKDCHSEVWPVNSAIFRNWVSMQTYRATQKVPRGLTMQDALSTLNGLALHDGEQFKVHLRVATDGSDGYYLDMTDDSWQVIHITPTGWQILNQSPVVFRRSSNAKPLPTPISGGSLADLKKLVNVSNADDYLLVTLLLDWYRPETAYPVAELIGEQGSGKSSTADNMRSLVDPNTVNLRNAPKTTEDIFVSARNNHVVCYNNLSRISNEAQDAMCNLSTGGGYASRKLYTNDEETTYEAKRPVLINGINAVATQADLVSRTVRLECPPLGQSGKRLDDRELADIFDNHASRALGFLLDTFVSALAILPSISLVEKPRLMDFATLGAAVGRTLDPVSGERLFTTRYQEARQSASIQSLESMPVIAALLEFLEVESEFSGTYGELLRKIELTIGRTTDAGWPKSPRGFSDCIGRAKPILNLLGWSAYAGGRTRSGSIITIKKRDTLTDFVSHNRHNNH